MTYSSVLMEDCVIESNLATAEESLKGAAIHNKYSTSNYRGPLVMRGCILKSNIASSSTFSSVRRTVPSTPPAATCGCEFLARGAEPRRDCGRAHSSAAPSIPPRPQSIWETARLRPIGPTTLGPST